MVCLFSPGQAVSQVFFRNTKALKRREEVLPDVGKLGVSQGVGIPPVCDTFLKGMYRSAQAILRARGSDESLTYATGYCAHTWKKYDWAERGSRGGPVTKNLSVTCGFMDRFMGQQLRNFT
jgi:hypothetical protein